MSTSDNVNKSKRKYTKKSTFWKKGAKLQSSAIHPTALAAEILRQHGTVGAPRFVASLTKIVNKKSSR